MTQYFEFYGFAIAVQTNAADLATQVRRDFSYFQRPAPVQVGLRLELHLRPPQYDDLPDLPASFLTPRNVCYEHAHISYIDYFGRGLAVYDRAARHCLMEADEIEFLREMAYLFILSATGEQLDAQGLHRLHALGLVHRDRAVLLLLPSGGGKSTMALHMLEKPGFSLLGEDTPLIDRRGRVLPFPLCMGVRPGAALSIPPQHLRQVSRMEFDPKILIDIDYFADRLSTGAEPGIILIGQRNLGQASAIVPLARRRALHSLVKYMVVGLGVYQGMEFVLERGMWELLGKSKTALSRLYNSLRLLQKARPYRFVLGRDLAKNTQTLLDFLDRQPH